MSNLTTDRATKKAYFTDLDGGHLLEFQFAPFELNFEEGGRFVDRLPTGRYFNELVWISGKPTEFNLQMFIDRTQESYVSENFDQDPFSDVRRFPNRNPVYGFLDIVGLIEGIKNSNTSSGFATSFKKKNQQGANEVAPSNYSASPHYVQRQFDEGSGVIPDLEALLYYVRPKGMKLSEATIHKDGSVKVTDYEQARFTPPPMIRFYYGNLWREGYVIEVKYNLSVMNKLLVPKRMDADIKIACTNWGYLNEMGSGSIDGAIDAYDTIPNKSNNGNFLV